MFYFLKVIMDFGYTATANGHKKGKNIEILLLGLFIGFDRLKMS